MQLAKNILVSHLRRDVSNKQLMLKNRQ